MNKKIVSFTLSLLLVGFFSCKEEGDNPTCKISAPANGITITKGDLVWIFVDAEDSDGEITEVLYMVDNKAIGSNSSKPYELKWNTMDAKNGDQVLSVIVTDNDGLTASDEINIFIEDTPIADFYISDTITPVDSLLTFYSNCSNNTTSWYWDFGDGSTSEEENPTHKYTKVGKFTVSLKAINSNGEDVKSKTDQIEVGYAPIADFIVDSESIMAGSQLSFKDNSSYEPTSWFWNFGDGSTSEEQNPTHKYVKKGTYTVSMKAINKFGVTENSKQDFITVNLPDITGQTGTLTDYDGNSYVWIGIGEQAWMIENLNVTHYPNGEEIPFVYNEDDWANLVNDNEDDAYCYFNNNVNNESEINGALYTYAAAKDACPSGWVLPSDNDWKQLEMYLGMNITSVDSIGWRGNIEGNLLKSESEWSNSGNGTNEFGFNAYPSGGRWSVGWFVGSGETAYWWCSDEDSSFDSYVRRLQYNLNSIYRGKEAMSNGYSVRCIKDL